jgi:TPR repeat protein
MKKMTLFFIFIFGIHYNLFSQEIDIQLLHEAAEGGDVAAQFQLATAYYMGQGVPQNQAEAVKWYLKLAHKGFAAAQHNLAVAYSRGEGVPQSDESAFGWYLKAAQQGDSRAQNNLGHLYKKGQGIPQDDLEATRWYKQAAEQGNPIAQYNLGVAYQFGEGVLEDEQEAKKWYHKAAQQGQVEAQEALDKLSPEKASEEASNDEMFVESLPSVQSPLMAKIEQENPSTHQWEESSQTQSSWEPVSEFQVLDSSQTQSNWDTVYELESESSQDASYQVTESTDSWDSKPIAPKQRESVVALNYARHADKPFIEQVARHLKTLGYRVDHIGQVNQKIYKSQWDIRYYDDEGDGEELKNDLRDFLFNMAHYNEINIRVRDFSFMRSGNQHIKNGRLELWILNPVSAPQLGTTSEFVEDNEWENEADLPGFTFAESDETGNFNASKRRKQRIALNYARKSDQGLITQLAAFLKEKGYTVDKIGRVAMKIYQSQWDIRYYYDRQAANQLKADTQAFFENSGRVSQGIRVRDFSFMRKGPQKIRKGRIELWILNP